MENIIPVNFGQGPDRGKKSPMENVIPVDFRKTKREITPTPVDTVIPVHFKQRAPNSPVLHTKESTSTPQKFSLMVNGVIQNFNASPEGTPTINALRSALVGQTIIQPKIDQHLATFAKNGMSWTEALAITIKNQHLWLKTPIYFQALLAFLEAPKDLDLP